MQTESWKFYEKRNAGNKACIYSYNGTKNTFGVLINRLAISAEIPKVQRQGRKRHAIVARLLCSMSILTFLIENCKFNNNSLSPHT